jgi:hypothetical protein
MRMGTNQVNDKAMPDPSTITSGQENDPMFGERSDPPPDGGYGWVCVAACFLFNAFTWGVVSVSSLQRILLHV